MTDTSTETTYEAMIERAKAEPSYRAGLLAAALICRSQSTDPNLPPCPSEMAAVYIESVANGELP